MRFPTFGLEESNKIQDLNIHALDGSYFAKDVTTNIEPHFLLLKMPQKLVRYVSKN